MTPQEAESTLADADVVPCLEASLRDAKELREACLLADIPALLDRASCCGKGGCGCGPKLALLVREDDVPRVAALMRDRFADMIDREDVALPQGAAPADPEGDWPCPACGTVAPLVEGACSDCGLKLE